jgi:retron-type reverse transcriptase
MTIASLISLRNLDLAWSRITTAKNHQHKRMFRHLYYGYEPGRRANIALLHEKLQGGWKATRPIRIYMPKASGLLRPLTLLALEDQIVLQAIANRVAGKLFARRKAV